MACARSAYMATLSMVLLGGDDAGVGLPVLTIWHGCTAVKDVQCRVSPTSAALREQEAGSAHSKLPWNS